MNVPNLYTGIPQEEGPELVCQAYDKFTIKNKRNPNTLPKGNAWLKVTEHSFQVPMPNSPLL